jgi:5-methylcytosine-specific restriction protein A
VPTLSELTDPDAVQEAITEFLELGRDQFLDRYSLTRSRDYFVAVGDLLVDSKPILSVAYAKQYPDRGLLSPLSFNGGPAGAGRALGRLGFQLVTRAAHHPPHLGVDFDSRSDIWENGYGGDKVAGIMRFPGDPTVNAFSDEEGPYADDPPSLSDPFGYRGGGRFGDQKLHGGGNAFLEQARLAQEPVRFWYRPAGGRFTFLTWVVVLGRAWVLGVDDNRQQRREIEWQLEAVPAAEPQTWPSTVTDTLADTEETTEDNPTPPEAAAAPSYRDLIDRVKQRGQNRRPGTKVVRTDYARSAAARRAVLVRAGGKCESPRCTGMPGELTRAGQPMLDVDHIQDLGLGGDDHPLNMAALCPNCHACKTRGANARQWRAELKAIVKEKHSAATSGPVTS